MTKVKKREITADKIKGTAPETSKTITMEVPTQQEMDVFKAIKAGVDPKKAMVVAGFNLPDASAERKAGQIMAKYNDRMKDAYDGIGLTPEFIAQTHMGVMLEGKDGDKLKAIDQVLQIQGGYAPKQVEVNNVTFEQAVIEIGQIVNVHKMTAADVRQMLAEDAEIVE